MKKLPLTKEKVALVDNDVYEWAKEINWQAMRCPNSFYARTTFWFQGKQYHVLLHHAIMGRPLNPNMIDHRNGDGLDNRRENLFIVNKRQNCLNQKIHRAGKLWGTTFNKRDQVWRSQIRNNGEVIYLGSFTNAIDAHKAYIEALKRAS